MYFYVENFSLLFKTQLTYIDCYGFTPTISGELNIENLYSE